MILVDVAHLNSRILYSSIATLRPKKKNGKYITDDFKDFVINGILTSFGYFIKNFKEYGEIVCCLEGGSWRKDYYGLYKANRQDERDKSEINFDEVYQVYDEVEKALSDCFGIKTLRVNKAEGDDIIAVLSKLALQTKEKTIILSSDKDFKQLLKYNIDIYDPIKKEFRKRHSLEEIKEDLELHIIQGDDTDNIPNLVSETEFSSPFLSYLKENDVFCSDPVEFFKLSISKKLIEDYDIYKVYKTGKNKGKAKNEKDIYKTSILTKKKIEEIKEIIHNDKEHIYSKNYNRNKVLIDFDFIPKELQDNILNEYKNINTPKINPTKILEFCSKHKLKQIMGNYSIFLVNKNKEN